MTTPDDLGRCLVTGSAGYLAGHLVRALLKQGYEVRGVDLKDTPIQHAAFEGRRGDLRRRGDVEAACRGIDTVFHTAAVVDFVGVASPARRLRSVELNVVATENVIAACRARGATRLVYTSTNNVLLGVPVQEATSRTPYPARHVDLYSETKTRAERMVLDARDLLTVALRPGGIYGIGDPFYLPQLLDTMARGLLRADIGTGESMADNTYVGNLVHGELLAARSLRPGSPSVGRAYYITDGEPTPPMEFFRPIIEGLGYEVPTLRLPYRPMYALGWATEWLHRLGIPGEPALTRLHTMKAALSHSGSLVEARRDLGYEPVHAWRDALEECLPYCRDVLTAMKAGTWDPSEAPHAHPSQSQGARTAGLR